MSTKIKEGGSGKNFELPVAGNYVGRCVGLIMIGLTDVVFANEVSKKSLLRLRYELPTELEEFKEGEPKQPWVVEVEFTNTTGSKGNLFKWVTQWNPKITAENIVELDFSDMLGAPGLISITHNPDKKDPNKKYLKAIGISSLPKGMDAPAQMNPSFLFDTEEFDQDKFNTFPPFIRKKILASEEFKALGINPIDAENKAAEFRGEGKTTAAPNNDNGASVQSAEDAITGGGDNQNAVPTTEGTPTNKKFF